MKERKIKLKAFEKADLRAPSYVAYLEKAATYDVNDYTYTYRPDGVFPPNPVRISWTEEGIGQDEIRGASVLISESPEFFDAREIFEEFPSVTEGGDTGEISREIAIYNLIPDRKYYYRVRLYFPDGTREESEPSSFTAFGSPRILRIDGVKNFRDLGGKPAYDGRKTKWNTVFRSAALSDITEDGRKALGDLHIRTELDLRSEKEVKEKISCADIPVYLRWGGNNSWMLHHKDGAVTNGFFEHPERTGRNLRLFSDPSAYPVLVHCLGGADRTGTFCAFLELLCGVSENDVAIDYETTNRRKRTESVIPDWELTMYYSKFMAYLKEFPGETLMKKTEYIATHLFRLSPEEIGAIRENMTEL